MAATEKRVRVACDVDASAKRKLALLAAANQRSVSAEVRIAIEERLEREASNRR